MATIWAPRIDSGIGQWQDRAYATGWSHTIPFSSLRNLLSSMSSRRGLQEVSMSTIVSRRTMQPPRPHTRDNIEYNGLVTRLGIVAHGDTQGVVQLERNLTANTAPRFRREFERLCSYLTPQAQVIFFSCVAGSGAEGARLLNAVSRYMPGRTVIGFTVSGETSANETLSALSPQSPGHIREAPHGPGTGREGREGLFNPWSVYAKWSRNGVIVRDAVVERDAQRHCANPNCPGHTHASHHCEGWF